MLSAETLAFLTATPLAQWSQSRKVTTIASVAQMASLKGLTIRGALAVNNLSVEVLHGEKCLKSGSLSAAALYVRQYVGEMA